MRTASDKFKPHLRCVRKTPDRLLVDRFDLPGEELIGLANESAARTGKSGADVTLQLFDPRPRGR